MTMITTEITGTPPAYVESRWRSYFYTISKLGSLFFNGPPLSVCWGRGIPLRSDWPWQVESKQPASQYW